MGCSREPVRFFFYGGGAAVSDKLPVRCKCGRLYRLANMTVADQSVCPKCREDLEAELRRQEEQDRR